MNKISTISTAWLLTALMSTGLANAASTEEFPAIGHGYQVDFGAGNAFKIEFTPGPKLTYTKLQDPGLGLTETVDISFKKLREDLYMVYWQEANKTTVVHIEDFSKGEVYTNITQPNGKFYNGKSSLKNLY